jgi:hypothetical protein
MVTALQYVAITGFLLWCLVSSLVGLLRPDEDASVDLIHAESTDRRTSGAHSSGQ